MEVIQPALDVNLDSDSSSRKLFVLCALRASVPLSILEEDRKGRCLVSG